MRTHGERAVFSFDLAYVDMTEGLAESKKPKVPFATGQLSSLSLLGYKVLPVIEPDPVPRPDEVGHWCETRPMQPTVRNSHNDL